MKFIPAEMAYRELKLYRTPLPSMKVNSNMDHSLVRKEKSSDARGACNRVGGHYGRLTPCFFLAFLAEIFQDVFQRCAFLDDALQFGYGHPSVRFLRVQRLKIFQQTANLRQYVGGMCRSPRSQYINDR